MAIYDSIDLSMTWDGDLEIGLDGDLKDTKSDLLQSLLNELHSVMRSEFDDWEKHPTFGAGLSEYRGEPNTRATAQSMTTRISTKIVAAGIVQPEDVAVRIIPVSDSQILVNVTVNATSTPNNRLEKSGSLVVSFLYDSLEDSIFFLDKGKIEKEFG